MKKIVTKIGQKSESELHKELTQLRSEIAKMTLEHVMAPQKDSNLVVKKRKQIAVILTVLNQKKS